MHPRSRHGGRYGFPRLVLASPELASFAALNPSGEPTIDFSDPAAVLALNRAILKADYGVPRWTCLRARCARRCPGAPITYITRPI